MSTIIQQFVNELTLGSVYALLALGYTMVYGISKLINFAHGDIYMLGAFFGYWLIKYLHCGFLVTIILAMAFSALCGVLIEFIAYRPLRNSPRITVLITAIGVSYFLENIMTYFFSADTRSFPQVISQVTYHFSFFQITNIQLLIIVTTIILLVGLNLIIHKTKVGRAMRAASADPDAALLMGINLNRTISITFALGSALAGAGGVLIGMYYNAIDPTMGLTPGIKAFVAAVLGGIGSIPGAALGGILIGFLETLAQSVGLSAYKDAVVYALLFLILLVMPAGILGKNQVEKV